MEHWAPNLRRVMLSSLPLSPPFLRPNKPPFDLPFVGPFMTSRARRRRRSCSLAYAAEKKLEASWIHVNGGPEDRFGGWFVSKPEIEDRNVLPKLIVIGVGTSMAILVAAFSYCSFSRKGFMFRCNPPFHTLYELLSPSEAAKDPVKGTESPAIEVNEFSKAELVDKSNMASDASKAKDNSVSASGGKMCIAVPVAADSTQQEALFVLKKLKIIENDASANELCTRREYARWLVKANSLLERNPNFRIVPLISIAGSMVTAFDDVSVNDPDFWCIQALGEAGVVLSKLLDVSSSSFLAGGSSDGQEGVDFSPESFISRFDLINWKAMLEYSFLSEMEDQMLRKKVGLLDLSAIAPHASPQLLTDLMAGDKSITRRVFGNIRRLQPQRPVTKAQAAVALTSGRMAETIRIELSRLEADNLSRSAEMEEIRSELIRRGEIQSFWEEKLNKEKKRGLEVESDFHVALNDLEKEKKARDESFAFYMKHKAALDCQQQLLFSLRKEVDGMCDRLASERANFISEQHSLEKLFVDLCDKQDAIIEAKSILEAEKEALRILRCWIEEEARVIQERAKVLEQAAQRWKWNDESPLAQPYSPENKDPQRKQA